jgi:hypothetical protein
MRRDRSAVDSLSRVREREYPHWEIPQEGKALSGASRRERER